MFNANHSTDRELHDLSNLIFNSGKIGRIQTLDTTLVLPGDSVEQNLVGAFNLSQLRRGLTVDSKVDIFTFYVPHRHIYGNDVWTEFIEQGVDGGALPAGATFTPEQGAYLGIPQAEVGDQDARAWPKWLTDGYWRIINEYFKDPRGADLIPPTTVVVSDENTYGRAACHLNAIWNSPLEFTSVLDSEQFVDTTGDVFTVTELSQAVAHLHTKEERQMFMQRYRDIIDKQGGNAPKDAEQVPTLLKRTSMWASGYDVEGTGVDSLGQYSGRVQTEIKHMVPRFFCPEHGTIWTLALVRFPPTHQYEIDFLKSKTQPTYTEIAGDSDVSAGWPRRDVRINELFLNADPEQIVIAQDQWYRYKADYVHRNYGLLQGYPFLNNTVTYGTVNGAYVLAIEYDDMFQTSQLGHWNVQCRNNMHIYRSLPTARTSALTTP